MERLANVFASIVAFAYRDEPEFAVDSVLVTLRNGKSNLLPVLDPMPLSAEHKNPVGRTMQLIQLQNALDDPDLEQLNAAFQYHRLALAAQTTEARLVNLWIALESLVRRCDGGSIIDRVCSQIPPMIATSSRSSRTGTPRAR